jgi:acetylornithine deacetylase
MRSLSEESFGLLEKLVAFDTTSRRSNLEMVAFVEDHLKALGVRSELTYDDDGKKANRFATIGPEDEPGIVLSGHTDVVPVDGQNWVTDPFRAHCADGRVFGRGARDMKGFIAVVLANAGRIVARRPRTPIHLAFSYDEEVGCLGAPRLLERLARRQVRPLACIVGEPTGMRIGVDHKGKRDMRCCVRGHEAHSSLMHKGANAIEAAAGIIVQLQSIARRLRGEGALDRSFDPPYSTIQTGLVFGGIALNIVPNSCSFSFELRSLPATDPDAVIEEIRQFAASDVVPALREISTEAVVAWEELSSFPGLDIALDHPLVRASFEIARTNETAKLSFGTEAGLFSALGIPTVIVGPGEIEQAHKPNEFVALEQIARCETFIDRLVDRAGADPGVGFTEFYDRGAAAFDRPV